MSHLKDYLSTLFPLDRFVEESAPAAAPRSASTAGPDGERKMTGKVKTKVGLENPETDRRGPDGTVKPWTDADLAEHFMKFFGVTVRGTGQHYLFKYYFILQGKRWTHPVTGDCRGTIMMRDSDSKIWHVACRPCAKFFNQQETHCPVYEKKEFDKRCEDFVLVEKADGTMISLWWKSDVSNPSGGLWQISTSTVVSAGPEWMAMMKPLFDISAPHVQNALNTKYTYILELCSKQNRVVTKYPDERVYLLVAIETDSGEYATMEQTDQMAAALGLMRPKSFKAREMGLKTLEGFLQFVEEKSRSPEFPPDPEGFVVYSNNQPLCKLKNKTYSAKHPFHSLGLIAMKLNILDRFFEKTTDDVMDVLPQPIKNYLDELRQKVESETQTAMSLVDSIFDCPADKKAVLISNPSEYVKRAKEITSDIWMQGYLLRSREWLCGEVSSLSDAEKAMHDRRSHFVDYLERNWRSKMPFWKETAVPEIVAEEKEYGPGGRQMGTQDN